MRPFSCNTRKRSAKRWVIRVSLKTFKYRTFNANGCRFAELLSAQAARAASLQQFVQREEVALGVNRVGMEDTGALKGRNGSPRTIGGTTYGPLHGTMTMPPATAPPGMPLLTGINEIADRATLAEWGTSIDLVVRAKENASAQTFLTIAQSCAKR